MADNALMRARRGAYSTEDITRGLGDTVAERGFLLPLGTYGDNRTGLAWPSIIHGPASAINSLFTNPTPYLSQTPEQKQDTIGNAFEAAGTAALGSFAATRPAAAANTPARITGYRGITDPSKIKSPDNVTFYSDRPDIADLYARDYATYGRRWPWENDKTLYATADGRDAQPWKSATHSRPVQGKDVGYADGAAVVRRDMTFNNPWTISGPELNGMIEKVGGFGIGDVLPDIVAKARGRGVDGIVLKDVQDIGGPQNQYISLFSNSRPAASVPTAFEAAKTQPKGITAYHVSPHDFDKFDSAKVGTGMGYTDEVHGLYFNTKPEFLEQYAKELGPGARRYEVNIDANPSKFLDWDAIPKDMQNILRTKQGTEAAVKAGVPGVVVRGGQHGDSHVVFDDALISILRKYGLLGTLGAGAAYGAQPAEAAPTNALMRPYP